MQNIINNFIDELAGLPESDFLEYGKSKNELIVDMHNMCFEISSTCQDLHPEKCDYLIFDYAGIGDSFHTRLLAQQLSQNNKICSVVPPLVYDLYADDEKTKTYSGFTFPFRKAHTILCRKMISFITQTINFYFSEDFKILNSTKSIVDYLMKYGLPNNIAFETFCFSANNFKRDYSIKHHLVHNGKITDLAICPANKYIIIEHCSYSFGSIDLNLYNDLISSLKNIGIDSIIVGSEYDPFISNTIDGRGLSTYDTYTLIKNSIGFVGRNSGNQCMTSFCENIPVFEIGVPASLAYCKYRGNIYSFDKNNFTKQIMNHYIGI